MRSGSWGWHCGSGLSPASIHGCWCEVWSAAGAAGVSEAAVCWRERRRQARWRKVTDEVGSRTWPWISAMSSSGEAREGATGSSGSGLAAVACSGRAGEAEESPGVTGVAPVISAEPMATICDAEGGGVGGLPLEYFVSYRQVRPFLTHLSHGIMPLHFDFLSLQKSHARLTLTGFRRRLCTASSAPGDVSECPRFRPGGPVPGEPEAGGDWPRGVAPSGLVDAPNIVFSLLWSRVVDCVPKRVLSGALVRGGVVWWSWRPDKGFPTQEMEKQRKGARFAGERRKTAY